MYSPACLKDAPLAILDTETTGLGPTARVIEVAVVHMDFRSLPRVAFSARLNPGCPIEPGASAVHGITDADVADAPTFADIVGDLLRAIEGRVVCAYNAPFDYARLCYEVRTSLTGESDGVLAWPWVDGLVLRKARPRGEYGDNTLADVCADFGCTLDAHGAAGDAMALALALPRLAAAVDARLAALPMADFFARQRVRALKLETGFTAWAHGKGWRERPDCPWHELAGLPLPPWPARPKPAARCPRCGQAPVTLQIAKSGDLAILNALGLPHACDGADR